jgi:hypothetical protein
MIRNGELPSGELCPHSDRPATETVYIGVECERAWLRQGDGSMASSIFTWLLFGWIAALIELRKSASSEEVGRDTFVELPLSISSDARERILGLRRQSQLKSLLRKVPIYSQLLDEFPEAIIFPARTRQPG